MTPLANRPITRRQAIAILGASALALACAPAEPAPIPAAIAYGRDECDYCRMTIDDAGLSAQHVSGRRVHRFGEVGCLLAWIAHQGAAAPTGTAFVAVPAGWERADAVRYARGRSRTPMRFDITVVAGGEHADGIAWPTLLQEGTPRVHAT